jgi:hypothetical protein
MTWPWRRRRRVKPSAADCLAADRLATAEREVELSRQRLRDTHENVVEPLRRYAAHNSFAEIIAQSLTQGRRKGSGG